MRRFVNEDAVDAHGCPPADDQDQFGGRRAAFEAAAVRGTLPPGRGIQQLDSIHKPESTPFNTGAPGRRLRRKRRACLEPDRVGLWLDAGEADGIKLADRVNAAFDGWLTKIKPAAKP